MKTVLLEHLAACERIVRAGEEVVPAWRIGTAEGDFLILTRFDHDKPEQVERLMHLMRRFMVWKMALYFIVGLEAWLGSEKTREGDEAIFVVAVSSAEPVGVMRRIRRNKGTVTFGTPEWLAPGQIDQTFIGLLPGRVETLEVGEAEELARIFGVEGELPAVRMERDDLGI